MSLWVHSLRGSAGRGDDVRSTKGTDALNFVTFFFVKLDDQDHLSLIFGSPGDHLIVQWEHWQLKNEEDEDIKKAFLFFKQFLLS